MDDLYLVCRMEYKKCFFNLMHWLYTKANWYYYVTNEMCFQANYVFICIPCTINARVLLHIFICVKNYQYPATMVMFPSNDNVFLNLRGKLIETLVILTLKVTPCEILPT